MLDLLAPLRPDPGFQLGPCISGAGWIFGVCPAVGLVQNVPQGIHGLAVAGRRNVEASAGTKFHARGQEVKLDAPFVAMAHPQHVHLIPLKPCKGKVFKGLHCAPLLSFVWRVFSGKADHARTVGPLVRASINQQPGALWVSGQDLGQGLAVPGHGAPRLITHQRSACVIGENGCGGEIIHRGIAAAPPIGKELDQHAASPSPPSPAWRASVRESCRSMLSKAERRASASS